MGSLVGVYLINPALPKAEKHFERRQLPDPAAVEQLEEPAAELPVEQVQRTQ